VSGFNICFIYRYRKNYTKFVAHIKYVGQLLVCLFKESIPETGHSEADQDRVTGGTIERVVIQQTYW